MTSVCTRFLDVETPQSIDRPSAEATFSAATQQTHGRCSVVGDQRLVIGAQLRLRGRRPPAASTGASQSGHTTDHDYGVLRMNLGRRSA